MLIEIIINSYVGEFGIVYKGYIVKEQLQGSVITDTVAIKTLKGIQILCILSIGLPTFLLMDCG